MVGGEGLVNSNFNYFSKVEFLRFDGVDVQVWVHKVEQFFIIGNVQKNCKVKIATIHLDGKALLWRLR